ncbi:MAG: NAD(P)-dependent oxidoreductase [Ruminococcus sp.]|nr:NAD(P)-dependent oxidoreductase [Ruminococcus sp.]
MKAVVFGGSGFLGSYVADELLSRGYEVIVFDKIRSGYLQDGQTMIIGDILDRGQVNAAIAGCDYVYNYAGIADLDDASTKPVDTVLLNVVGTCNIMDACVEHNIKRFIYASSFYANSEKGGFYRCSKQSAEIYIEEYERRFNLEYTVLRYGSLYGPRADKNNGMKKMIEKALSGNIIHCFGTEEDMREYIHVADAAKLSVDILNNKYINQHLQLTGQERYTRKQIMVLLGEILDKKLEVIYDAEKSELHYNVTPYTYKPHTNYKVVSDCYHDLGQGIIECIREIEENVDRC